MKKIPHVIKRPKQPVESWTEVALAYAQELVVQMVVGAIGIAVIIIVIAGVIYLLF